MTSNTEILEELKVRRVIESYFRLIDDGSIDRLAALFEPDGELQVMDRRLRGRASIEQFMRVGRTNSPDELSSIHVLSSCLVDVAGEEATAVSDWVLVRRKGDGVTVVVLAGRFYDQLRRSDEIWRFVGRIAVALSRSKSAIDNRSPTSDSKSNTRPEVKRL